MVSIRLDAVQIHRYTTTDEDSMIFMQWQKASNCQYILVAFTVFSQRFPMTQVITGINRSSWSQLHLLRHCQLGVS